MITNKYYQIAKKKLYPLCRSITGNGVRNTLKIIKKEFPRLKILEVRSNQKVFDWKIPPEWNIKDAYVIDKNDKKIINFKKHNLHVVNYSTRTKKVITKKMLLKKLHSLPKQPNAIPYVTSYYKKEWGFCISQYQKNKISKQYTNKDKFKVFIDSNHNNKGSLTYGELIIKGKSEQEILISTYICHPSMANNELSGPIVSMALINKFSKRKPKKTLRFLFIPETIGSIAYLSKNLQILKKNFIGGFNLSCIGDDRQHSCMLSKYGNSNSDKALLKAYKKLKLNFKRYSFLERGSDERQYNSPGIDLGVSSIFRSKYNNFKEYHTSLDDFTLVTKNGVFGGYTVAKTAIEILLDKTLPKNIILCEPQMGKRGLYPTLSKKGNFSKTRLLMSFLQYADGTNDLDKISKLIKCKYQDVLKNYKLFIKKKLII